MTTLSAPMARHWSNPDPTRKLMFKYPNCHSASRVQVDEQMAICAYHRKVCQLGNSGCIRRRQLLAMVNLEHANAAPTQEPREVAPANRANALRLIQSQFSEAPAATPAEHLGFGGDPLDVLCLSSQVMKRG